MQPLGLIKVVGDGDCLFHALGAHNQQDGAALRIEVASFMAEHAADQQGVAEEWLREVEKLRAYKWGGATVIAAYSLMKNVRVMVHTWRGDGLTPVVTEMSHGDVYGKEDCRTIHVLYNNRDHYDCLVEVKDPTGMDPAWPQPPPPKYFDAQKASDFPALPAGPHQPGGNAAPANKNGMSAPRPPKKGKAKAKGNAKATTKKPEPAGKSEGNAAATAAAPTLEHEEEDSSQPGLMEKLLDIPVTSTSLHPHRQAEDLIKDAGLAAIHG